MIENDIYIYMNTTKPQKKGVMCSKKYVIPILMSNIYTSFTIADTENFNLPKTSKIPMEK
jgi:hypothetical protein